MDAQINRSLLDIIQMKTMKIRVEMLILLDGADNDGPITEMMDHSLGQNAIQIKDFYELRNQNNNQVNDGNPNVSGYKRESKTQGSQ